MALDRGSRLSSYPQKRQLDVQDLFNQRPGTLMMPDITGPVGQYNVFEERLSKRAGMVPKSNDDPWLSRFIDRLRGFGHDVAESLSDQLEAQTPQEPVAPEDPLGDLYSELVNSLRQEIRPDLDDLMQQIQAQINPVFDAQRETIEMLMARQEQQGMQAQQDVQEMYDALAVNYEQMVPEVQAQAQQGLQDVEQIYGQLKSNIEGNYSKIQGEQAELFQQLGIESALPEVLAPQGEQAAEATSKADELSAINEQRYEDIGNIDASYYRQGAPLARLTGSNRASDLAAQLQDYLFARGRDISELEAQRTSDITGAFGQLSREAQSQAGMANRSNTEMLFQLLRDQQQQRLAEMEAAQQSVTPTQQLFGSVAPMSRQRILDTFNAVMQSPDVIAGRRTLSAEPEHGLPAQRVAITDAAVEQMLRDAGQEANLSPAEVNALISYYRLYSGVDPELLGLFAGG